MSYCQLTSFWFTMKRSIFPTVLLKKREVGSAAVSACTVGAVWFVNVLDIIWMFYVAGLVPLMNNIIMVL